MDAVYASRSAGALRYHRLRSSLRRLSVEPDVPFRLAHLSDPHLTSPESVRLARLMGKRLIGYLSWRTRRRHTHRREMLDLVVDDVRAFAPDHTVITGDLTHLGLATEFQQAHLWLQSFGTGSDVTVVPGNHDIYARDSRHRVEYWADYISGDDRMRPGFPFVRVRGPVAFVGVNSGEVSPPFFATGSVGPEQREALEKILEDLAARNLFRVVLMHHSPVVGEEHWRKRLVDASEVAAVLARRGSELVLCGHGHRVRLSSLGDSGIPVVAAASASSVDGRVEKTAAYHRIEVAPNAAGFQVQIETRVCFPDGEVQGNRREFILASPRVSAATPVC